MRYITIPASSYIKFASDTGKMPDIVINVWKKIWQLSEKDLGGVRSYIADFEIYDGRSADPMNATMDVYIGII